MIAESASPTMRHTTRRSLLIGLVLAAVLLALISGFLIYRAGIDAAGPLDHTTRAVSAQAVEEKWGIRITQVAVTADGGMIDFRYQVIDPDKAINMAHDLNNMPVLLTEDNPTLINSAALMTGKQNIRTGGIYFILYRNTGGAAKPGGKVSAVFGDERLEHLPVQ